MPLADDSAAPPAGETPWANNVPVGLLVRGYANVQCVYRGRPVAVLMYVRLCRERQQRHDQNFDATSDSSNNVALSNTQAQWASDGKDANNIAEIRLAR